MGSVLLTLKERVLPKESKLNFKNFIYAGINGGMRGYIQNLDGGGRGRAPRKSRILKKKIFYKVYKI